MKKRKSFKRTLKLIFGVILVSLVLSELFAVLETLGIGSVLANGIAAIVLIVVSIAATFAGIAQRTRWVIWRRASGI